jgi:uncharacterized protein (DUF302 family)
MSNGPLTAFDVVVDVPMPVAEAAVRQALGQHGFGVLTEIDLAANFKLKLGVDVGPLKILGACNPSYAYRAVLIDSRASLALPCNVVLEGVDGATRVSIVDPRELMTDVELTELAEEVALKLQEVLMALKEILHST